MVYIDNLVDRESLQIELIVDESPLEIAHARNSLLDALVEHPKCLVTHGIDATRDIFGPLEVLVAESAYLKATKNITSRTMEYATPLLVALAAAT